MKTVLKAGLYLLRVTGGALIELPATGQSTLITAEVPVDALDSSVSLDDAGPRYLLPALSVVREREGS